MWPWKRVEVTADEAGDDATATLTMVLRQYGRSAAIEDVRRAIYPAGGAEPATAADIVRAAASFGMLARGLLIEDAELLGGLRLPNIAHLSHHEAPFGSPFATRTDTYFVVVERIRPERITFFDPYEGRRQVLRIEFSWLSTGIFLLFEEGTALPAARAVPSRRN